MLSLLATRLLLLTALLGLVPVAVAAGPKPMSAGDAPCGTTSCCCDGTDGEGLALIENAPCACAEPSGVPLPESTRQLTLGEVLSERVAQALPADDVASPVLPRLRVGVRTTQASGRPPPRALSGVLLI